MVSYLLVAHEQPRRRRDDPPKVKAHPIWKEQRQPHSHFQDDEGERRHLEDYHTQTYVL